MPRIPPSLVRRAHGISPHASLLLPACRDLPSTLAELRWIRDHVQSTSSPIPAQQRLRELCRRRGKGIPLQYVLGTQPFGQLDLRCRPGILIPRPEPEAYAAHLAHLIKTGYFGRMPQRLGILDLCSGTGCIALLLFALLQPAIRHLGVRGIDVSQRAVDLSRENLERNVAAGRMSQPCAPRQSVEFSRGDILSPFWRQELPLAAAAPPSHETGQDQDSDAACDVLISNPPYVSAAGFARDTARSVRNYEPKPAQVPWIPRSCQVVAGCEPEDVFYARLLEMAEALRPRIVLFEVGDEAQARRVVAMAMATHLVSRGPTKQLRGYAVEIWRDWPEGAPEEDESTSIRVGGVGSEGVLVPVKGTGHVRSVLMFSRG